MTTKSFLLAGAISGAVFLAGATPASAQKNAFWFPVLAQGNTSAAGTDGFEFRPRRDLWVVSLGYYDHGRRGLDSAHRVTLYETNSRRRIAFSTIDKRGRTIGRFSYRRIRPRLLKAGISYTVAGYHSGSTSRDQAASAPPLLSVAPEIEYGAYRFNYGPAPAFPNESGGEPFFGPGFQFLARVSR